MVSLNVIFEKDNNLHIFFEEITFNVESRIGAVVRALTFYQCVRRGLSLLLVLALLRRFFSGFFGFPVFLLPRNPMSPTRGVGMV